MPCCSVVICKNRSNKCNFKYHGVTFHRFPRDPTTKKEWINATNRGPNWWPPENSTICSSHFEEKCFKPFTKIRKLFDWAVPTLKLRIVYVNVTCPDSEKSNRSSSNLPNSPVNGNSTTAYELLGMSQYTLAAVMMLVNQQMLPKVNKEWAETLTNELKEDLIKTLGDNGVLIFPSAPAPAPYHYSLLLKPFDFAYWGVFNALHCPAVQIPLGLNADGVPLGIQIVGAPKQEKLLVTVATHFEKLFGGYVPPCNVMK